MLKINDGSRRLHPKLRTVRNGDETVNRERALRSGAVVALSAAAGDDANAAKREAQLADRSLTQSPAPPSKSKRRKLTPERSARNAFVNVFIELQREGGGDARGELPALPAMLAMVADAQAGTANALTASTEVKRNVVLATVPVEFLTSLESVPDVAFVHPAEPLKLDRPTVSDEGPHNHAPAARRVKAKARHRDGAGVLIGIIDVGGFDFSHRDFLDADGKTRFVRIWDQGGAFRAPPARFGYGAEFTQDQLNAALKAQKKTGLPATRLEEQSQRDEGSHGTHVASIAAGNRGVCPKARIAAVLISLPQNADTLAERRATFSDSSRIAHAVEYLVDVARAQKLPLSINISLGTNGGAHDGSNGLGRWLAATLSTPGITISVASGNAGQTQALAPGDLGWVLGRVHAMGKIPARGLQTELEWVVAGNGIVDVSENELEIWYGAQDRITVRLKPPGSSEWIEVKPREFVENRRLPSGTFVSIYNELYHPANGCNYVALYLSPDLSVQPIAGIEAGTWRLRLVGEEIRAGGFHAWIERDDPQALEPSDGGRQYFFPSFFSAASMSRSHTISSLACAHSVVAVANLDGMLQAVNATSSPGPTRDDRMKPDIAAHGTDVLAANGFGDPAQAWISMTGTSMASPYVAGVLGLMLSVNPKLSAAQCLGILQRTSQPLPGHSYEWRKDCGFGQIDPAAAVEEAASFDRRVDLG